MKMLCYNSFGDRMKEKYADLLLKRCLSLKSTDSLLINAPIDSIDFIRILTKKAYEIGIKDIYLDLEDEVLKYNELKYLSKEELKNSKFFNKSIFDEYAKRNAAFLMLCGENSDIMKDISKDKISYTGKLLRESKPIFKEKEINYEIPWCIALVATSSYAKKVFPNETNAVDKLWDLIFKITLCDKDNPIEEWTKKIELNKKRVNVLNNLKIKSLSYTNKLGTKFSIGFTDNIWCGTDVVSKDGRNLIVNMPSEEIFTTPNKYTANGIIYASRPLVYNGALINNFWIKFKDGKVIDYDAETGREILESIINIENGNYLGEVALVDKTSPIFKSNTIFYETLYDENASCHLALGEGFTECINTDKTLEEIGFNNSITHVDFMIGTDDLNIVADTNKGKVTIMENGKFVI